MKRKKDNNSVNRGKLLIKDTTAFSVREAYKLLRTNIMYSSADANSKTIVVSSPEPGAGKSTTTLNTAITFAEAGKKVLIIDADMRSPQIHRALGVDNQVGLSTVLVGAAELHRAIRPCKDKNIDILTSGKQPPNPSELLSSEKMNSILEEVSKEYDYIFIDTPPIILVSDALILSKITSGIIIVVRENSTNHKMIKESLDRISMVQTKVLGLVLTNDKVRLSKKNHYYTSAYSKYSV